MIVGGVSAPQFSGGSSIAHTIDGSRESAMMVRLENGFIVCSRESGGITFE
jgi:hypothetical protein